MRRVELYELIRHDHKCGLSIRAIARKRGVHRRTVRQARLGDPARPQAPAKDLAQADGRDHGLHHLDP